MSAVSLCGCAEATITMPGNTTAQVMDALLGASQAAPSSAICSSDKSDIS